MWSGNALIEATTSKRCTHCGETKPVTSFSKCYNGFQSACRPCRNAISKSLHIPVTVTEQLCYKCKKTKPASEFNKNRRRSTGLQHECKQCNLGRKRSLVYPVSVSEKYCPGCDKTLVAGEFPRDKKRADGLRGMCRACCSIQNRASIYRIPAEQVKRLVGKTKCDMCRHPIRSPSHAHIDHCHETGVVRGTLCAMCNKMIGCAGDSVEVLQMGIDYLIRTGTAKSPERRGCG